MTGFLLRKRAKAYRVKKANRSSNPHRMTLCFLLVLALLPAACDNSFDPVSEDQTDFFGVFGYLDTAADTQFVRVSPLRATLAVPVESLHARVTTVQAATGATMAWQDSLVQLDDGSPGLLFFTQIPVMPGETYQLSIEGEDDEVTRAVTQIPEPIRLAPEPVEPDFTRALIQRLALVDQSALPEAFRVRYEVMPPEATEPIPFVFPVFSSGTATAEGVEVIVHLEADRAEILHRLQRAPDDSTVVLYRLGMEFEQLSPEWQSPETPVNIENGFGFFGAIAHTFVTWQLDPADVARLGYQSPE